MKTAKDVLKAIKDNDVKYVDLRFTDPRGKWQHVTFDQTLIDEEAFAEGLMFDGSSIAGWRAINESDMTLMPDPTSACMDPFFAASTMVINCDILDPASGQPYNRDPRGIAKKAEAYLKSTGIGDTALLRPRGRVLRLRRRPLQLRPLQHRIPDRFDRTADQRRHAPTKAAISATASAPRAAISRCRRRIRRRTCAARCWRRWRKWARWSRSTTTRSRRRSTSSASSSARSIDHGRPHAGL